MGGGEGGGYPHHGKKPWLGFLNPSLSWYQCLTKCWRYMQRERKRRGLMRPPSAPRGQRGSWWAVETMDNSDPRPSLNLISPLRTGPLSCPIFNNHCPLSRRPSQFDQRTQQNASSLDFCIGMLYCRVRISAFGIIFNVQWLCEKMTRKTLEVCSKKRKPREDRQNHRYHRYHQYHGYHM